MGRGKVVRFTWAIGLFKAAVVFSITIIETVRYMGV